MLKVFIKPFPEKEGFRALIVCDRTLKNKIKVWKIQKERGRIVAKSINFVYADKLNEYKGRGIFPHGRRLFPPNI